MKRRLGVATALTLLPGWIAADSFEVTLQAGQTFPFYQQTFQYRPPPLPFAIPGASIEQQGSFEVKAQGGLALGGSLDWVLAKPIAIEARFDSGSASAALAGARYDVRIDLPRPLPSYATTVDLGSGSAELEGLRPISLNLQLRLGSDRLRVLLSGGGSYLPSPGLSVRATVGLGIRSYDGGEVQVMSLVIESKDPSNDDWWGGNLGVGMQIGLSRHAALAVDGRVFVFGRRQFTWEAVPPGPSSNLEQSLLDAVLAQIDPLEFTPAAFQLAGGLNLRF